MDHTPCSAFIFSQSSVTFDLGKIRPKSNQRIHSPRSFRGKRGTKSTQRDMDELTNGQTDNPKPSCLQHLYYRSGGMLFCTYSVQLRRYSLFCLTMLHVIARTVREVIDNGTYSSSFFSSFFPSFFFFFFFFWGGGGGNTNSGPFSPNPHKHGGGGGGTRALSGSALHGILYKFRLPAKYFGGKKEEEKEEEPSFC